ncbi:tellurite resistance protein TerC [uncultured Gammaproteobacteria bacterium]
MEMFSAHALLTTSVMGTQAWLWLVFLVLIAVLLTLDLGLLNRRDHEIGIAESLELSAGYVGIAFLFGLWVTWHAGKSDALIYYTGYLIEESLSIDNIFVISLILGNYKIPRQYQHRVLFWGIVGVIVLRGIFIGAGTVLISQFQWVLYLFGIFLLYTGIKMFSSQEMSHSITDHPVLIWLRRHLNLTTDFNGHDFFILRPDPTKPDHLQRWATPLFQALVLVELSDIAFAVDSVPAILAITQDPYLVYTSNIFAILGLRSLYFALSALIHRFCYLKFSLSLILIFVSIKIFLFGAGIKTPPLVSLSVISSLLAGGIFYSLYRTRD